MSDNVVDFNEALKRAEAEEQQKSEHICSHCELKSDWAATLLYRLQEIDSSEEMIQFVNGMYDEAFDEGRRDAFEEIIGFAGYNIDQIDGVIED